MPRPRFFPIGILIFASFLYPQGRACAQEVRWRHDYAAARREATETGRPLLLDFGTESCFWCKKLDATTFREAKVVKLLNEGFIPVKVDANQEQRLTQALGVDGFPTLILATADGKVVGRHPGYGDAAQIMALLNKAPAPAAPAAQHTPTWTKPVVTGNDSEADRRRRVREQIDADLAALHPRIAAALDR